MEGNDTEAVVEVLAKLARSDGLFQIFIGGCNDTDIRVDVFDTA